MALGAWLRIAHFGPNGRYLQRFYSTSVLYSEPLGMLSHPKLVSEALGDSCSLAVSPRNASVT